MTMTMAGSVTKLDRKVIAEHGVTHKDPLTH